VDVHAKELRGTTFRMSFASVGATENLMMAATLIPGKTILQNAAMEPEITDLADMLNAMGARIRGAGTETITIEGVDQLHGPSRDCRPDRSRDVHDCGRHDRRFFAIDGLPSGSLNFFN
jgi:UDP-N-acetylglucosamine 1-carboxyvinyltransferase